MLAKRFARETVNGLLVFLFQDAKQTITKNIHFLILLRQKGPLQSNPQQRVSVFLQILNHVLKKTALKAPELLVDQSGHGQGSKADHQIGQL